MQMTRCNKYSDLQLHVFMTYNNNNNNNNLICIAPVCAKKT